MHNFTYYISAPGYSDVRKMNLGWLDMFKPRIEQKVEVVGTVDDLHLFKATVFANNHVFMNIPITLSDLTEVPEVNRRQTETLVYAVRGEKDDFR